MDLRLTFNENPDGYDQYRPSYVKELFEDFITYSNLSSQGQILEVGMGTGQATQVILDYGCHITAVELGKNLAAFSRNKFKDYSNLEILNKDFEKIHLHENTYDAVFSATAFHWIDPEIGLNKVKQILKNQGSFAWFSNHPGPHISSIEVHDAIQVVYEKYNDYFQQQGLLDIHTLDDINREKLLERQAIFMKYGFKDVIMRSYTSERIFNGKDYGKLLLTYSGNINLPDKIRDEFIRDIQVAIESCGDVFKIKDTQLLVMGKVDKG